MTWLVALLIISILIFINALYVAAEFATVSARRSRLVQLAAEGSSLARMLVPIVRDRRKLDTYVATCQIGITVSSLLLGYFGQSQLTPVIVPLLGGANGMSEAAVFSLTATLVLVFLTTLQVIMGELVPKSLGIQYPERLALLTTLPMRWSTFLLQPLIWLFNGSGRLVLRLLGHGGDAAEAHTHVHTAREILMLFEESSAGGLLDREERRLLRNSLQMREVAVRQVMIPRNRMFAAPVDETCERLLEILADSPYSRLPLYEGSVDQIIGMVHLKDLFCLRQQGDQASPRDALRPVVFVPENIPAHDVFEELQRSRSQVAVVLDEYGGTAGFVTLEDLIEEIFGELQDEFDLKQSPPIRLLNDEWVEVRGDLQVDEINEALDLLLSSEEADTIGGWVLNTLGHVPSPGENLRLEELELVVEAMRGNAVTAVRFRVSPEQIERLKDWI
jgi:putative hemolysin